MEKPLDKNTAHIAAMFNHIAPQYDFLNHLLSLGIDRRWRRRLVRTIVPLHPKYLIDIATGTGDLALALHKATKAAMVGVDISENMLAIARNKQAAAHKEVHPVTFHTALAEALPFPNHTFDVATIGFGVRNFEHLQRGLQEAFRVLKPGGTLAVLEFTMPVHFLIKPLYQFYFHRILPVIGKMFSKHRTAYSYLPASVDSFPQRGAFLHQLQQAGFSTATCTALTCGIAMLYVAKKARTAEIRR